MCKRRGPILGSFLIAALPSVARPQPVGGEFQVNSYTTGYQRQAAVSSDANGNFVVVWASYGQDGSYAGIFGQRYDSKGNVVGGEFQVNSYTTGGQGNVYGGRTAVSSGANGFVVVWTSEGQDGDDRGIFGQRYDSRGNRLGGEFQINSYTTGRQWFPAVASDADGNFVVVWDDDARENVFGQRYDATGKAVAGEFQANSYAKADRPWVASAGSGDFVVVWDRGYAYHGDIFGQRFDRRGNALGGEFQVNSFTTGNQYYPVVSIDAKGDFVVVWYGTGVSGQRYDRRGNEVGSEFQVNFSGTGSYPAVSSAANGDFVVVWQDGADGSNDGVFGQRFSRTLPARCLPPPARLTGWWPGDGNTLDIIGGRSAVLNGDATTGLGYVGQAFVLDGDGDFVDVPDDLALDLGTGEFTVDLWVRFNDTAGEQVLVEKWIQRFPGELSEGWTLTKLADNTLGLFTEQAGGDGAGVATPGPLPISSNTWNHFAATRAGSRLTLFMNGAPVAELDSGFTADLDTSSSLKFGHRGNPADTPGSESDQGFYLNGLIDEVELFVGRALTRREIQAIFNAGSTGKCKR